MGACCSKKRPNIATGHSQTVVLAVEMRYPCKCRERKLRRTVEKCRGVQHVAYDHCYGLLTVVGVGLDPLEIQHWAERKACGRATIMTYPPPLAAQEGASTSGGGENGGRDLCGMHGWNGPAGLRSWTSPVCAPPCPPPKYGYYYCPYSSPFA